MMPLPHEIELQKVLDTIREVAPHFKVPPLYMFKFLGAHDSYYVYGRASEFDEISLSLKTIGNFNCKNDQFVKTIVHEVVHLNCWEDGHNKKFKAINSFIFRETQKKLNRKEKQNAITSREKEAIG